MPDRSHHILACCGNCRYFRNDAGYLERLFPGLTSLSSGYGSVRSNDGVCSLSDRYLRAEASCRAFVPAHVPPSLPGYSHPAKRPSEALQENAE